MYARSPQSIFLSITNDLNIFSVCVQYTFTYTILVFMLHYFTPLGKLSVELTKKMNRDHDHSQFPLSDILITIIVSDIYMFNTAALHKYILVIN